MEAGTAYQALGLDPSCRQDEIDDAYRALAKEVHPDRGGDAVTFAVLTEAYDDIRTPARRAEHDRRHGLSAEMPSVQSEPAPAHSTNPVAVLFRAWLFDVALGPLLGLGVIGFVLLWILWNNHPVAAALVVGAVMVLVIATMVGRRRRT